ncbi:MAG: hypothetical protein KC591_04305, partial [Gemmatimonadetes bacterium]|nr:hypothetical protein [Gemmatimonadota bacterium]
FRAFRTSWVFHRMPLLGALGATFAVAAVALPNVRRSAHRSGVALFAWWFLATWIGASLLPYAAPRYFVPAVFALMPCAVAALEGMARARGPGGGQEAPPVPPWFVGVVSWAAGVAAIEAIAQWSIELTDSVLSPDTRIAAVISAFGDGWGERFAVVPVEVGVAAAFAVLVTGAFVVARSRLALPDRFPVRFLVAAIGLVQLGQLGWFFSHRTDHLVRAAGGFDVALPAEAVAWGGLAPTLAFDGPRVARPQFGSATWDEVTATEATHLVLAVPGELDAATREGWLDSLQWIARWPLRGPHLAAVDVYRVRGTEDRVPPSALERAVVALEDEDWPAAGDALAAAPDDSPDVWRLRAVAAVGEGRFGEAEAALGEVVRLEPRSAEDWYRLGNLRAARGDAGGASAAWREGLAIDPFHPDLRATGVGSGR